MRLQTCRYFAARGSLNLESRWLVVFARMCKTFVLMPSWPISLGACMSELLLNCKPAMPWEVSLRRKDDHSLGELSLVSKGIEAAFPETQFYREASGKEKRDAAIARGVDFPAEIRAIYERQPAKTLAHDQIGDLTIVFDGFEREPLQQWHAEIRGKENPAEALLRGCEQNVWQAIDDSTGKMINLRDSTPASWQSFVEYRERATDPKAGETA